jgi:hypothetical protein
MFADHKRNRCCEYLGQIPLGHHVYRIYKCSRIDESYGCGYTHYGLNELGDDWLFHKNLLRTTLNRDILPRNDIVFYNTALDMIQ